jgi:transketolase
MRHAFAGALIDAAAADPRVWLVTGDVGYSVLEPFRDRFPDRFLNAGVAEQNMLGVAAGLALAGHTVFAYSLANFPTLRCFEQLRNDVAYHRLNVKVVAVGGGLAYGGHGFSHHAVEDLGVVRLLPAMTVVAPGDSAEAAWATAALAARPGPAYLRLGRGSETPIHPRAVAPARFGEPLVLRAGGDVVIASTGGTLTLAIAAADALAGEGISAGVVSIPVIVPFAAEALFNLIRGSQSLVTVEDHGPGGLGSIVAESIALRGLPVRLRCVRFGDVPVEVAGSPAYLSSRHGVDVPGIVAAARQLARP